TKSRPKKHQLPSRTTRNCFHSGGRGMRRTGVCTVAGLAVLALWFASELKGEDEKKDSIIPQLTAKATFSDNTVPANGDVNPYGVAFVPNGFPRGGVLRGGDIIVSNFNNSANLQGTGTTIVRVNNGKG